MTQLSHTDSSVRWYIIHAYSGQEKRVKDNLEHRIKNMDMQDKIFQVVVPTEDQIEIKGRTAPDGVADYLPWLYSGADVHGRSELVRRSQYPRGHWFHIGRG